MLTIENYVAPEVEIIEVAVEKGFAVSLGYGETEYGETEWWTLLPLKVYFGNIVCFIKIESPQPVSSESSNGEGCGDYCTDIIYSLPYYGKL